MEKCEYRICYAVPEMFHPDDRSRDAIHAIMGLDFMGLGFKAKEIRNAGYRIVGVDRRIYDDEEHLPWDYGWVRVKPIKK